MIRTVFMLFAVLAVAANPAHAHMGIGTVAGFAAGFSHPLGGLDHVLAMVAVGLLAAQQGGRSLWLVPGTFVAMMVAGGMMGAAGLAMPFVEQGILGSIVILGAVVAFGHRFPLPATMAMVGLFALFHGHVHGTEMPMDAIGFEYGLGFALATASLHGFGLAAGLGARRAADALAPFALRMAGGAIATAGLMLIIS